MSIVVLCPSRNRPDNAYDLLDTFNETRTLKSTKLIFVVDSDDETRVNYPMNTVVIDPPPGCMNAALNRAAADRSIVGDAAILGFVGDDHRFRTEGWDATIGRFLGEHPGIAYGDDLWMSHNLPTMWFVSRRIADRFGMGLGGLRHLWIDNYWKRLGDGAGCLYYFPNIVIEHVHPFAGKGDWNDDYARVNSQEMVDHDYAVYSEWFAGQRVTDVAELKKLVSR